MPEKRLVWDLPLRLFHWLLVLSLAASWYTAENSEEYVTLGERVISYTQLHFYLGYWALGLVLFRLIWGFVGPRHARFTHFLAGPKKVYSYACGFFKRNSPASIGHNPMGAWMVVLMLLMVGAQAVTGLFLLDNTEIYPAPFNAAVEAATASKLGTFHHVNFDVLLWVIGVHVVAVLFYVFFKKQNLISAMLSGNKDAELVPADQAIKGSQLLKALIVAIIAGGAVYLLLEQAPEPVVEEYY
jgi:cytochrome b